MAETTPLQQEAAVMPPEVRGAIAATLVLAALGAAGAALLPSLRRRTPRSGRPDRTSLPERRRPSA